MRLQRRGLCVPRGLQSGHHGVLDMRIVDWGVYYREDKPIGYAFYRYANGRLVLKWRIMRPRYIQRYDGTKPWHRGYITEVLDHQIDVENEVEAWAMLEIVD